MLQEKQTNVWFFEHMRCFENHAHITCYEYVLVLQTSIWFFMRPCLFETPLSVQMNALEHEIP